MTKNISVTRITGDGQFIHHGNTDFNGELSVHSTIKSRNNQKSLLHLSYDLPNKLDEIKGDSSLTMVN